MFELLFLLFLSLVVIVGAINEFRWKRLETLRGNPSPKVGDVISLKRNLTRKNRWAKKAWKVSL